MNYANMVTPDGCVNIIMMNECCISQPLRIYTVNYEHYAHKGTKQMIQYYHSHICFYKTPTSVTMVISRTLTTSQQLAKGI